MSFKIFVWSLTLTCLKSLSFTLQDWAWVPHQHVLSYVSTSFLIPFLPWALALGYTELLVLYLSSPQTMLLPVFAHAVPSTRKLSSPKPSLIFACTALYRLSSGINYMGLQDAEPSVPSPAVTGLCPCHVSLKWSVHVPISAWTTVSSRTRSIMTNICISVVYPRIWHRVGTWQVFCWTELSGDLGRRHSRDRTCDLGFISISVKQWSQPPKDWQKLAILGIRVNCSWDQHSPMWVTQIGLVVKKASVLHSMS